MIKTKIQIKMKPTGQIIKRLGLDATGEVQRFHTQNVLRRIVKYMPFTTGATIKLTQAQTNIDRPEIVTETPYAEYIFKGKVKVDPKTGAAGFMTPEGWRSRYGCKKVETSRNLVYNRTKNPKAGPRWDIAVSTHEGKAMAADVQRYIDKKAGKG